MYDELQKLAQTEGNEPIRCSRMHFSEWADDVDKLEAEIERLRADVATLIACRRGEQLAECRRLLRERLAIGCLAEDSEEYRTRLAVWYTAAKQAAGGGDE